MLGPRFSGRNSSDDVRSVLEHLFPMESPLFSRKSLDNNLRVFVDFQILPGVRVETREFWKIGVERKGNVPIEAMEGRSATTMRLDKDDIFERCLKR